MPVLTVGKTMIPYEVRHSDLARRHRIIVTPGNVEVVAPVGSSIDEIAAFVHRKRRWVFDEQAKMRERTDVAAPASRFVSGIKVPFRGRRLKLVVKTEERDDVGVSYRTGFIVSVPVQWEPQVREAMIEEALSYWFRERLAEDVYGFVDRYSHQLGVEPKAVRLKEQTHLWGSCRKDGIINLNWHLIFVPKPVLEYAVVHELCHLVHRNHTAHFWALLRYHLPDYEVRKRWLDDHRNVLKLGIFGKFNEN